MTARPTMNLSAIVIQLLIILLVVLLTICAAASPLNAQNNRQGSIQSKDGYVRRDGSQWIMGTALVQKRVGFEGGRFLALSLRNKQSGRDYVDEKNPSAEIRLSANGHDVSAPGWQWKLGSDHVAMGAEGELQLDIDLESANVCVTKHYVIYPGTAVIRVSHSVALRSRK